MVSKWNRSGIETSFPVFLRAPFAVLPASGLGPWLLPRINGQAEAEAVHQGR